MEFTVDRTLVEGVEILALEGRIDIFSQVREICYCFSQSEVAGYLHIDISWLPRNDLWLERCKQAKRIVHMKSGSAPLQAKSIEKVFYHLLNQHRNTAAS